MIPRRHTQTLYPLPEHHSHEHDHDHDDEEEDEETWSTMGPRTYSALPQPTQLNGSRNNRSNRSRTSSSAQATRTSSTAVTQYSKLYSQFVRRYRSNGIEDTAEPDDPRNDPDSHYFQRGLGQLTDAGDNSEDEDSAHATFAVASDAHDGVSTVVLEEDHIQPASPRERERLEWQALLTSVLSGDVLKSEKTRIAVALNTFGDEQHNNHVNFWLGIRAKFHGRSVEEEKRKLEERRLRTVDGVINEVLNFTMSPIGTTETSEGGDIISDALTQVTTILRRLDIVQSLYPTLKAFYLDKPIAAQSAFQARADTLNTWYTVLTTLKHHFALLRRWTGSDTLDVNQPFTSHEVPIGMGMRGRSTANGNHHADIADGSSFVERLLKEESMQLTFEKGFLVTVHAFLGAARDAQVNLSALFKEMNLPTFEKELVPLISFPTKLAQAGLRLRLDYVQKLKDPDVLIIDQMTEDLKLSIGLACTLKRQYEAILAPDPGGNWNLPECISEDYDSTILEALVTFFKLLHWQLKSGAKGILFKETDVLEAQWATFNDVSITTPGGSSLVAEQLCSLTNKLMVRVTNYFDTQVRVPLNTREGTAHANLDPDLYINGAHQPNHVQQDQVQRKMTDQQVISWYSKILESVRLRYRKLQRFSRVLTQRFSNSAEYSLDDIPLDEFINLLVNSDHFLVYTHSLEEEGVYVVASSSLFERPEAIRKILDEAFQVDELGGEHEGIHAVEHVDGRGEDEAAYLLVLSPQTHFLWNGRFMSLSIPKINLDTKDNRVRLIADGPQRRLSLAKQAFAESLDSVEDDGEIATNSLHLTCLFETQAHLPSVNRELRKIARATNRLAESIVDSVHHVRNSLRVTNGGQELLANWYLYASEHAQHAHRYMDRPTVLKFNRLLIKLAISWVSFICDDCDPTDRRTFKWAVNALEYTLHRTKRDILHLPDGEFEMLRQKVASCMTLLISHFDILGARSISEARKEKEKQEELLKMQIADVQVVEDDFPAIVSSQEDVSFIDSKARVFWERVSKALREIEDARAIHGLKHRTLGKVLNDEIPEDRSLSFLASSSSNISVRWQQGKFIGAGAFGSVYLALNLDSGSLMAVKEIKFQELSGLPNLFAQIKEELSVMEMLHHPNVVEYYGIEVHRDKVYIFEEFCQGGSLAASLSEHGRIEDETLIQVYTMQMLEGLAYLHSQDIVHRDVKPDNILLDHMGVIKFVDFGAAKILAKNQRTVQRSRRLIDVSNANLSVNVNGLGAMSNGLTGTPMYMSPEVIKNDKRGRHGAMDIWSLGCVVLECATGKKPWSNLDNEWAIMFHIGVATQHPPLPEPGQLSELGINFIKQCLTIDPVRRPSAAELMNHPWMIEFRETLELTMDQPVIPEGNYEGATVARQAAIVHEQEIELIRSSTPVTPPFD
ncbi:MAP kinase kinase kinase wis4 [Psilocybe cubensis]|uniref:Protein kinase domain-containing protein n=2 Tax=Psilocybe cubensis TaxID=181762 RepID=A0A8H7YA00_PSICU|nr:MAP kinase kinase kinase wis4 [Psilocybe cubensis]KAH9486642.1 MAP kinase kinase kinase wis4 [Psilocybe cubensis]